jgi:hypothetical protein
MKRYTRLAQMRRVLARPREQHADTSSRGLSRLARQDLRLDPELDEASAVTTVRPYQAQIGPQTYSGIPLRWPWSDGNKSCNVEHVKSRANHG